MDLQEMASANDEWEKKLQDSNATPMALPLEFLKAITCDFSTESELGRGGFGVVYKGVLPSGKIIAVKKLFEIHLLDDKKFQNELISLMGIKHQNVVQFVGYCAESSWEVIQLPSGKYICAEKPERFLCFEYVCNKSLDKYISDESSGLEWNMRYEIVKGICSGLHFLHVECRIVHLDLKPENILMDATMMPKLADFGLSRILCTQQSRIVTDNHAGSLGYMAPEYSIQGIVSIKADIFSLGVIIIEIITGHRDYPLITLPYSQLDSPQSTDTAFQHFTEKVLGSWRNKFVSTPKYRSIEKYTQQVKQCIAIALKCVDPVMEKRPTAKDIIQMLNAVDQMDALLRPPKPAPTVKRSASFCMKKSTSTSSLLLCTEGLGSESTVDADDMVRDGDDEIVAALRHKEMDVDAGDRTEAGKEEEQQWPPPPPSFPPPIRLISGRGGCFRSFRAEGRFMLVQVVIPGKEKELLQASREGGRLRLQFASAAAAHA